MAKKKYLNKNISRSNRNLSAWCQDGGEKGKSGIEYTCSVFICYCQWKQRKRKWRESVKTISHMGKDQCCFDLEETTEFVCACTRISARWHTPQTTCHCSRGMYVCKCVWVYANQGEAPWVAWPVQLPIWHHGCLSSSLSTRQTQHQWKTFDLCH